MTTKERILFGTLIGSLSVATVAGHVLMREYDKVTDERTDLYAQIAYLVNVMTQNGLDVDVFDGIGTVIRSGNDKT